MPSGRDLQEVLEQLNAVARHIEAIDAKLPAAPEADQSDQGFKRPRNLHQIILYVIILKLAGLNIAQLMGLL